jgi:hypothetical protein
MVICLVLLFCLCAGASAAASFSVFFLEFPPQIYLTKVIPEVPQAPGVPHFGTAGKIIGPSRTGEDPQDPEDPDPPDPQPQPIRPEMQGDLSGKDKDPPPPP